MTQLKKQENSDELSDLLVKISDTPETMNQKSRELIAGKKLRNALLPSWGSPRKMTAHNVTEHLVESGVAKSYTEADYYLAILTNNVIYYENTYLGGFIRSPKTFHISKPSDFDTTHLYHIERIELTK